MVKRPQSSMEAEAKKQQREQKESVRLPRANLCSSPPFQGSGRPYRDQETFLQKARREEMEVREMLEDLRRSIGLEGSL
ncbi:hypothetical protein U1Q18_020240 [Sarracenia purpurea var. burkii]